MVIFEIIHTANQRGSTYTQVFFTDGDNIYKTNINTRIYDRMVCDVDELQVYLRKRYDYHSNLVFSIDNIEITSLYNHFVSIKDDENRIRIHSIIRNRKIDGLLH